MIKKSGKKKQPKHQSILEEVKETLSLKLTHKERKQLFKLPLFEVQLSFFVLFTTKVFTSYIFSTGIYKIAKIFLSR
jgi:hypothetical protein